MPRPPNVLFILSDQHNAKVLGHVGHPDVHTPNLDRLAAEGVRFPNAITQNPICTPSRVSWLSGQYAHNHGYYSLNGANPGGLPTILGHFRRAGYRTAAVGKIHCPEHWVEDDADFFRESVECSIGGSPEYHAFLRAKGLEPGHRADARFRHIANAGLDGCPSPLDYENLPDGWAARQAVEFMQACADEGRPFFAHVSFHGPHGAYRPAKRFWDLYDESRLALPPNADYALEGKSPALRNMVRYFKEGSWIVHEPRTYEAARLRKLHGYLGMVSMIDHAVGELLDGLRRAGLEEDTIVVYSTDHGEYACEHGILEKAPGICADAVTRIPMMWRWPGRFAAGHVAPELVETVDLTATVCRLAGLEPLQTSDGLDIAHLLRGKGGAVRRLGVTEFAWSKSVRKGNFRYVYYQPEIFAAEYPDGFGELYDLASDPWEMKNLWFDPAHAAKVEELKGDLLDWLVATTRPRTVHPHIRFGGPQAVTRYHNTTNADGKVHADRLRDLITREHWTRNYL